MNVHSGNWIISIVALVFLANFCQGSVQFSKNKLIIDTDAGGDDAIALLLALSATGEADVLAITCTYGNTWLENVETNVLKTLTISNQSHIRVYSGADKPLLRSYTVSKHFGLDGMSDFKFDKQIVGSIDRSKHAALAMIDLVKHYPGEVNIAILGPTTNVALAVSLDPTFSRNVKRFYVMGSTPLQERVGFNFELDPESNAIFLNTPTKKTKLIISSAIASKCALPTQWRLNALGTSQSELIKFANNAESATLRKAMWRYADLITIAAFLWPELITDSTEAYMLSDTCNEKRGAVIFEYSSYNNVQIVTEFDVQRLKKKLLRHFA